MASKSVTIEGIGDLVKGFKDFNDKTAKNQQIGQKLAANEYSTDVKAVITAIGLYKKGDYRRSVHVEGPFEEGGITYFLVGTDNVAAKQHEFGGVIKAKKGPYLIFQIDGKWIQVPFVTQPPHPHFRPALDQNKGKYIQMMKEAILR